MAQFQFRKFDHIPVVIKNLLILNGLVWVAQITLGRHFPLENMFALHDIRSELFRPHQLITHMFMHDPNNFFHLLFNMFALWMFGSMLENVWGPKRFLIFYIVSGLGAAALHLGVLWYQHGELIAQFNQMSPGQQAEISDQLTYIINEPTLGASGAVFGCLAAFAYLFPNTQMIIIPIPIPVKAKWVVLAYAAFELYAGVSATAGDNVAHFAHLGGAIVGFLLVYYWNKRNRGRFY